MARKAKRGAGGSARPSPGHAGSAGPVSPGGLPGHAAHPAHPAHPGPGEAVAQAASPARTDPAAGEGGRAGPSVDALELLEPEPHVPPRPIALGIVALTLAAVAYFLILGVTEASQGPGRLAARLLTVAPRDRAPVSFVLESMNGSKVGIDDFPNKVVFLNFWATWCPPCVEEMPSMIRLYERLKNDPRFEMLAVSTDEDWAPVRKFFADRAPPPFKVLLDPGGKIAREYGTTMFPETYVLVNGRIVGFIEGPRDWDKWFADGYLRSLLR